MLSTLGLGAAASPLATAFAGGSAGVAAAQTAAMSNLMLAGLGVSILGTGASMYGQYQSSKAQQAAAKQNAVLSQQKAAVEARPLPLVQAY